MAGFGRPIPDRSADVRGATRIGITSATSGTLPAKVSHSSRTTIDIERVQGGLRVAASDVVAVEDPLEIRIGHPQLGSAPRNVSVTMRTPGHDDELALGYLYAEGVIDDAAQVVAVRACTGNPRALRVELRGEAPRLDRLLRVGALSSSCGACGKVSLDAVLGPAHGVVAGVGKTAATTLFALPARLRAAQVDFAVTGGLHGVALFQLTGELLSLREDVGRHNAFDKLVGHALVQGQLPWTDRIVLLSGRASFELLQKSARAGASIVAAIGAPSSLAIETARAAGITLIGFLRDGGFNVYSGPQRIG